MRAAFTLAETYDAIVLEKGRSEVKAARSWYGNAKELGSEEALQRLRSRASRIETRTRFRSRFLVSGRIFLKMTGLFPAAALPSRWP